MSGPSLLSNLPQPADDGACNHLAGISLPSIALPSTSNQVTEVDLSRLDGLSIVFCYPRSAAAGEIIPPEWDAIPGARGCTPQACSFRDNSEALYTAGVKHLFGLSTQPTDTQQEFRVRTQLPYDLLSDADLAWASTLQLPLFEWQGIQLVRRLTLAICNGKVVNFWYPVFPPDRNVYDVLDWLKGWSM